MEASVLIISFYFPPYPKVGSRRWVKFAKYLKRAGKNIHVLAAKMDVDKESPWDNDAKEIESITTRLFFKYHAPFYKRNVPKNILQKIKWHISKLLHDIKGKSAPSGNPNDSSEIYAEQFIKQARSIIQEKGISTVIFTASPNHLAFHLSELKKEFPDVKFLFDLRDYWSDWMKHLTAEQFNYESNLEKKTVFNSDIIVTPAKRIADTLCLKYPNKKDSIFTLPHAYDSDDFEKTDAGIKISENSVYNLVYAGSMYPNMEANIKVLAELLDKFTDLKLTFYTFTNDYSSFFNKFIENGRVVYLRPLPVKKFTETISATADALLYMRSELNDDNNFLSSKFFDFLPFKKPIVYLGKAGDASEFIINNQLGFHLQSDNILTFKEELNKVEGRMKNLNIELYSFKNVTKKLIDLIEN